MPPIIIQLTLIQVRSRQIFDCMLINKVTIKESELKIKKKRKEKNGDIRTFPREEQDAHKLNDS